MAEKPTTTLTREALLEQAQPEFTWATIEGIGRVGIRSVSEVQRSRRIASLFDADGNIIPEHRALRRVHLIIDHLMADETTPMFTDADINQLGALDGAKLDVYVAAINHITGSQKKESAGSKGAGES